MRTHVLLFVLLGGCLDGDALETSETSQEVGIQGTYSDWWIPNQPASGFYNIDQTFFPANLPMAGPGEVKPWLYYSSVFGMVYDGPEGGYIGIQVDPNGRRAIFSIWGANAARCGNGPNPICRPFSGEGVGYQTMIDYPWVAGHYYRTRVWAVGTDAGGEWWVGAIKDESTGIEKQIGTIRIPLGRGWLESHVYNFVEWYGPQPTMCSQLPASTVYFGPPRGNVNAQIASNPWHHLGNGACPSSAYSHGEWARHHNGNGS